jgi:hypothetical protein
MHGAGNMYCSRCLSTRRFLEVGDHYECERCRKMLHKVIRPENIERRAK